MDEANGNLARLLNGQALQVQHHIGACRGVPAVGVPQPPFSIAVLALEVADGFVPAQLEPVAYRHNPEITWRFDANPQTITENRQQLAKVTVTNRAIASHLLSKSGLKQYEIPLAPSQEPVHRPRRLERFPQFSMGPTAGSGPLDHDGGVD
jgi:hypothetical protein